jgi:hypothetical protein
MTTWAHGLSWSVWITFALMSDCLEQWSRTP